MCISKSGSVMTATTATTTKNNEKEPKRLKPRRSHLKKKATISTFDPTDLVEWLCKIINSFVADVSMYRRWLSVCACARAHNPSHKIVKINLKRVSAATRANTTTKPGSIISRRKSKRKLKPKHHVLDNKFGLCVCCFSSLLHSSYSFFHR